MEWADVYIPFIACVAGYILGKLVGPAFWRWYYDIWG
jgi:hypothetical protein